ncbi:GNAT family N-acetyltransferase [Parapedobacter indicus]|uniref:N-acetyltransferase domain-containing protein n=1 Tax=Parapedobacter indicus TaxID=1477437 RepID=A0A1I3NA69_9SPHI|nr:GNAT family N-acetyltransferase [Parapedobacter indicus]PPL00929.1 hypothetical protein CLV26_107149 [Parapedobacter indicus]SFJ06188.1 hypothetical protein SAMN05444682_107149 [Parapedobacter indicus]
MSEIINNTQNLRFEIHLGTEVAYLEYRFYKKDIAFMHTFVPEAFKGKGIASQLAQYAFAYAKREKKPVMVYCPFVSKYVKAHPAVKEQLDKEYHKG